MSQVHILNGKIIDPGNQEKINKSKGTGVETAASKTKSKKNTEFNKDMFLKLLAAEMQYQDPMAPTKNSEYVSEMATFAQVEATQNVSKSVDSISASSLIGKYATVSDEMGDVTGIVNFISKRDDGIYVSINNKDYLADKIVSIKDSAYFEATMAATAFSNMMQKLPEKDKFSMLNEKELKSVNALFKNMTPYTKQFLNHKDVQKLNELNERYNELTKNDKNDENKKEEKTKKVN